VTVLFVTQKHGDKKDIRHERGVMSYELCELRVENVQYKEK
jgi:hypothetical protein